MGSDNNTLKLIDLQIEKLTQQTEISFADTKQLETLQKIKDIILNRPIQEQTENFDDVSDKQILEILNGKKKKNLKRKGN